LVLPGNQVSRRHAMIHVQGQGEHWLVDLGSSNGIILNGRRVKQPVALKDQDRLEIGPNVLTFRKAATAPGATPMPAETTSYMTIKASTTANLWLLIADIEKFTPLSQTMPGDQLAKLVGNGFSPARRSSNRITARLTNIWVTASWPTGRLPKPRPKPLPPRSRN